MIEEKTEVLDEKKKSKKKHTGLVIVLVLLIGILVGGGSIYYYFEILNNSTEKCVKEENKTNVKSKVLDVYSSVVQDNFSKFMTITDCQDPGKVFFKNSEVVSSDIDNITAITLAEPEFYEKKGDITKDEYENTIKEYFGKDYKYSYPENIKEACLSHVFDKQSNTYKQHETACGCTTGPNMRMLTRIASAELRGNELILTVKVLFPSTEVNSKGYIKYFSDADHKNAIEDIEYTSNGYSEIPSEYYPVDVDSTYAKGGTYKFVMKKYEGDKYSFVSSKPVE